MKTFLYIAIVFLFGLALIKHREQTDYSKFDSLILKSQKLRDSALCELKYLQQHNDSLMNIYFR
jgi:hypothetical protein